MAMVHCFENKKQKTPKPYFIFLSVDCVKITILFNTHLHSTLETEKLELQTGDGGCRGLCCVTASSNRLSPAHPHSRERHHMTMQNKEVSSPLEWRALRKRVSGKRNNSEHYQKSRTGLWGSSDRGRRKQVNASIWCIHKSEFFVVLLNFAA